MDSSSLDEYVECDLFLWLKVTLIYFRLGKPLQNWLFSVRISPSQIHPIHHQDGYTIFQASRCFNIRFVVTKAEFPSYWNSNIIELPKDFFFLSGWMIIIVLLTKMSRKNENAGVNKRYFIIDQQIAQHFGHYSECLYNPLSLLCNSNNKPISYFKALNQYQRVEILANRGILKLVNVPLV